MKGLYRRVDQELFHAAEQGNISEVEKLFSLGADVLARNSHHTVLHSAVLSDNENLLKLFLDKIKEKQGNATPLIDGKDSEGDTPLMWTAESKYVNAARILLEYGADVEAKNNDGMTALHWAAKRNHLEVIKLLIGKGAEVNVKDKHGKKPSDYAREEGHKEVDGYLIFSFAEILRKQGQNNEALEAYKEAISIQEAVLGPDHLDTLMTRHNMAEVLSNQGKHAEALQLYQKVYDIQKRTDVLGHDHPHTLKTLFNMAVAFSEQGNNSEVSRIFRDILNIKGVKFSSNDVNNLVTHYNAAELIINQDNSNEVPRSFREILRINDAKSQTNSNISFANSGIRIDNRKKMSIERDLSKKGDDKPKMYLDISRDEKHKEVVHVSHYKTKDTPENEISSVCSSSKSHQEVQKLDEEYLLPKRDELEVIKKDITDHLKGRLNDVYIVRGKDRGKKAWHYALIDPDKKEKFLEKSKTGSLDVADYGKILFSGWGENPPESIRDKVTEFFSKKVSNDFFVTKEKFGNKDFYHYALIDPNKTKMFQEESKKGLVSLKRIQNCGSVFYSGWGQEPPENISYNIISTYFSNIEMKLKEIFTNLFVKDSKTLHDAAKSDKLEALEGFVRKGVNSADKNGWTLLHHAAYIGNLKVVNYLIDNGANLHVKDIVCDRQPLHIAAREGHKDVVELLLNKSLDVFKVDRNNWTSLHYATWSGSISVVKLLIDKGFDIHAKEATRGKNPIHIAAERGYMDIVKLFLRSGSSVDDTDREDRTSLYYAAIRGHLEVVKYLADRGANIHAKNAYSTKPIHVACLDGHINVIQYLLHRGVNVNDSTKNKETPLHYAAHEGQLEVAKFLLKKGAAIDVRNDNGKTPPDLAEERGHMAVKNMFDGLG